MPESPTCDKCKQKVAGIRWVLKGVSICLSCHASWKLREELAVTKAFEEFIK
jgi:hypothetical protein